MVFFDTLKLLRICEMQPNDLMQKYLKYQFLNNFLALLENKSTV